MKKALVVLLALVLGAGLLFAADAKWSAWIEGDIVLYDDAGNAYVGPGWGTAAGGQYSLLSLSYSEDNFGFAMTDEFGSDNWNVALRNITGWYKLFDGMVKLTAGKIRTRDYEPTSNVEGTAVVTRLMNKDWGVELQLMPVKGLSVGVFAKYPVAAAAADYANALGFGVSYDIENIAKISATYSLVYDEVSASVEVKAIKGLPILAQFMYDLTTSDIKGLLSTSYSMDKLSIALDAEIISSAAFDFGVEANVGYALSDMYKVGATLGYATAGGAFFTDLGTGVGVYPWVNVTVGGGSLNLGFCLSTGDPAALTWKIPLKYLSPLPASSQTVSPESLTVKLPDFPRDLSGRLQTL